MHRRLMLALALTVLAAADVDARICVSVPLKWVFKQHDVVFIGRVHESTLFGERTIEITDGLKNARAGETVTVRLPYECCPNFSRGDMPLVFAQRDNDGHLHASVCAQELFYRPEHAAIARRRAWWWRLGISNGGWYPVREYIHRVRSRQ